MSSTVASYVKTCPECQRNKSSTQAPYGLLQSLPITERPWSRISMDFIVSLPVTAEGFDAIMVVVDCLTKMIHCVPTHTTATAQDTAFLFLHHILKLHGPPDVIVSDRDPKFMSEFWQDLFKLCGTRLNVSTANHPQTDGQTERANRTLEDMLRSYISPFHNDWYALLPVLEFAYNSSRHASTQVTPFQLNYGFTPPAPVQLLSDRLPTGFKPCADASSFVKSIQEGLSKAKACIKSAQEAQAAAYNKRHRHVTFKVGDKVLLSLNHFSNLPTLSQTSVRKFLPRWFGPYEVLQVLSSVSYKLKLPARFKTIHPVFHVSRLRPFHDGSAQFPERLDEPPPEPDIIENEEHFAVSEFLSVKGQGKRRQILVQYTGYPEPEWQPYDLMKQDIDPATFDSLMKTMKNKAQADDQSRPSSSSTPLSAPNRR